MKKIVKKITAVVITASLMFACPAVKAEENAEGRMDKAEVRRVIEEIRAKVNNKSAEIIINENRGHECSDTACCCGESLKKLKKEKAKKIKSLQKETSDNIKLLQEETSNSILKVQKAASENIKLAKAASHEDTAILSAAKNVSSPAPAAVPSASVPLPAAQPLSPVTISGYTQIAHTVSDVPADSHSFNVARTRFVFKRKLDENLSFFSQFNVSGNNADASKMTVTDIFVQYNPDKTQNLMLGQFVVPGNYEATISPRDLYMINYGQLIINAEHENRGNDLRDLGVTYNYRKPGEKWGLSLAAVNGEGINTKNDSNDSKAIFARLDVEADPALKIGLYASDGKRFKAASTAAQVAFYGADGAPTPAKSFDRKRAGFDLRYKKDKFTLQGVFEALETGLAGRAKNLQGKGAFVQSGYFIMPKLELTYKYDRFDPDKNNSATRRTINAAGFNWFIKKGAKLQMVYQKQKETPEVKNDRMDTLVTVEF